MRGESREASRAPRQCSRERESLPRVKGSSTHSARKMPLKACTCGGTWGGGWGGEWQLPQLHCGCGGERGRGGRAHVECIFQHGEDGPSEAHEVGEGSILQHLIDVQPSIVQQPNGPLLWGHPLSAHLTFPRLRGGPAMPCCCHLSLSPLSSLPSSDSGPLPPLSHGHQRSIDDHHVRGHHKSVHTVHKYKDRG